MSTCIDVPSIKKGVNGADVYTEEGVGSNLVTLYTMLVRDSTTIAEDMEMIVRGASPELLKDLWVLAFQTRDVRGGKGERKLFYKMFSALKHTLSPFALNAMIALLCRDIPMLFCHDGIRVFLTIVEVSFFNQELIGGHVVMRYGLRDYFNSKLQLC